MAEALSSSSQGPGSPSLDISEENVKYLLSMGFSKSKNSRFLSISHKTLYNKLAAFSNPDDIKKFSDMSEAQLDTIVRSIKEEHPNDGDHGYRPLSEARY